VSIAEHIASTSVGSVEDFRGTVRHRRRKGTCPGDDADNAKAMEKGCRWQWRIGRAAQRTQETGGGLSYDMPSDSDDDDDDDDEDDDEDEGEGDMESGKAAVVGTTSTADEAMDEDE
jgi:hypothetical protein